MSPRRVAYLVGAGGSQASIDAVGSTWNILMSGLALPLAQAARALVTSNSRYTPLQTLVNEIAIRNVDFEHVITFLDDSPSALHRQFAARLRRIFETLLTKRLTHIKRTLGPDRSALYLALLDLHNVVQLNERLQGILTLNYDDFIEDAVAKLYHGPPDYGIAAGVAPKKPTAMGPPPLLKLHGSFGWQDVWPIHPRTRTRQRPLWLPPGIRKATERYPFNLVWGRAREVLDCDLLRVVGCRLSPTDWDLISLLFSTRHSDLGRPTPYTVEIIDCPRHAATLKARYPYLDVHSLLAIEARNIGSSVASQVTGKSSHPPLVELSSEEAAELVETVADRELNWFHTWLFHMGAGLYNEAGEAGLATPSGAFRKWWDKQNA